MPKILKMPILKLHGHNSQGERRDAYQAFRKVKNGVLISTDVGSRGLDFSSVNLIIVLDPPETLSHYSNRVGRTARLTSSGAALTFLHPAEKSILEKLQSSFTMNQLDQGPYLQGYAPKIPDYYTIVDSMIYIKHAIKKVSKVSFLGVLG